MATSQQTQLPDVSRGLTEQSLRLMKHAKCLALEPHPLPGAVCMSHHSSHSSPGEIVLLWKNILLPSLVSSQTLASSIFLQGHPLSMLGSATFCLKQQAQQALGPQRIHAGSSVAFCIGAKEFIFLQGPLGLHACTCALFHQRILHAWIAAKDPPCMDCSKRSSMHGLRKI